MRSILERFKTSEAEDRRLLGCKALTDWRKQMLVEFRVLRKQALQLTIESMEAALGKPGKQLHVGAPVSPPIGSTHSISEL